MVMYSKNRRLMLSVCSIIIVLALFITGEQIISNTGNHFTNTIERMFVTTNHTTEANITSHILRPTIYDVNHARAQLSVTTDINQRRALFSEFFAVLHNTNDANVESLALSVLDRQMTFDDRMAMIYNAELNGLHDRFGGDQQGALELFNSQTRRNFSGDAYFARFAQNLFGTDNRREVRAELRYFESIGCSFIAMANIILVEFANRPIEFENTFGFPMFVIDGQGVKFNFEMLALDIFVFGGPQARTGTRALYSSFEQYLESRGVSITIRNGLNYSDTIEDAFSNALNDNQHIILDQRTTILYYTDGITTVFDSTTMRGRENFAHAVTMTDITDDGNFVVSTWGMEALIRPADYLQDDRSLTFVVVTFERGDVD